MEEVKNQRSFGEKWTNINSQEKLHDETSVFVPLGQKPATQRQFILGHYFEYISQITKEINCQRALEVGCGRGTIALYLNKYLACQVDLLDNSQAAIDLARHNFAKFGGQGQFRVESVEAMTYTDNTFDLTVSIGLTEHFQDYHKVYSEQYRVLKPGGVMICLNVPKKRSIQGLNRFYRWLVKPVPGQRKGDYYRNVDGPADYQRVAQEVGFKRVKTFYVNSFPLFTPMSLATEKKVTNFYRFIYKLRGLYMSYPFRGSKLLSQAHFLIAHK